MKITPCPHGLDDVLGKSPGGRSPGLHVSTVYNDLYKRLEPKRYGRPGGPDPALLELGLAFELMVEEGWKKRCAQRPGELIMDGIAMSPDLIIVEDRDLRIGEMKLTYMSSKEMPLSPSTGLPARMGKWDMQMRSYCRAADTPLAKLIGFFVRGNYGSEQGPQLLAWDIEYTSRELEDNWTQITNHLALMRREGLVTV